MAMYIKQKCLAMKGVKPAAELCVSCGVGSADPTAFLKNPFKIYIFVYRSYLSMHFDPTYIL
jgi:hypothetical protein